MHGQRKPRTPRKICCDPMRRAILSAAKITPGELKQVLQPLEDAYEALRTGTATLLHWQIAASAVNVALAIEQRGIVRGLAAEFNAAERDLQRIEKRATAEGRWRSPTLYAAEIKSIRAAVKYHKHQLLQLSAGEAHEAYQTAINRIRGQNGLVMRS